MIMYSHLDGWIAANCVIKQGVTIGDGAVIGAHSFANTDIPPYCIAFGVPAKIHNYRFDESIIEKLNNSRYWNESPERAREILDSIK